MSLEVPPREQLTPAVPRPVVVAQLFPGGWSVAQTQPKLVLEQRWTDNLWRRGIVPLGPVVLAMFLFGVTREASVGVKMLAQPLAVILLGVAALGVLNFIRQARRKLRGIRLEVDAASVTGYPEARTWLGDYFVALASHPRAKVTGASLTVYRDTRHGTARAKVHVELEGGAALVGPEALGPDLEWAEVRDSLLPAAAAVARALGVKLALVYPWCEQRIDVSC